MTDSRRSRRTPISLLALNAASLALSGALPLLGLIRILPKRARTKAG